MMVEVAKIAPNQHFPEQAKTDSYVEQEKVIGDSPTAKRSNEYESVIHSFLKKQ